MPKAGFREAVDEELENLLLGIEGFLEDFLNGCLTADRYDRAEGLVDAIRGYQAGREETLSWDEVREGL